jgi:UDP-glucuronate 4-epimerase
MSFRPELRPTRSNGKLPFAELNRLVALIEGVLGRRAERVDRPVPPGDVPETRADVSDLRRDVGIAPATPPEIGVEPFVAWSCSDHGRADACPGLAAAE